MEHTKIIGDKIRPNKKKKYHNLFKEMKKKKIYYIMMAPYLTIFFVFTVLPVMMSLFLSFTYFDMINVPQFVGISNYTRLILQDDVFLIALRNTLVLAIIVGPISYAASFIFAWLINELPPKIRWVLTIIFYAPSISGSAFLLWQLIFHGDIYGYLNAFLLNMGIIDVPVLWLRTPGNAIWIIILVQLWLSLGISFLSFVAGLQTVDKTLYEAAAVDGIRNRWQELWYITLPQMKSQLMFGALMQITTSFSIGSISVSLLGFPSVDYSGHTIITHLLDFGAGSQRQELGYASAIATVLFLMMMVANLFVQRIIRRVGT